MVRESPALQKLDAEIRQLTATLRSTRSVPMQQDLRYEASGDTAFGDAVRCIHEGPHRKWDVMAGRFDKEIHTLFTSYLATKYPGASQESIRHHANNSALRMWSWGKVTAANIVGTTTTTLLTSVAPKLGLALGFNASALGAGLGITAGSALVPALLAALPIGAAIGATHIARRMTRDERESRKAGNILHKVLHDGPELQKLRTAVASGHVYKAFDDLIRKSDRIPEKYSNKLWSIGMLGVGGVLGAFGAGSLDIGQKVTSAYPTWLEAFADWQKVWADFSGQFFYKDVNNPGAWQTGVRELTDLGKYIWTHALATVGYAELPPWQQYIKGFPR
jgi:hypothetical protein